MGTRDDNTSLYDALLLSDDIILCFVNSEHAIISGSKAFLSLFYGDNKVALGGSANNRELVLDHGSNHNFLVDLDAFLKNGIQQENTTLEFNQIRFSVKFSEAFTHGNQQLTGIFFQLQHSIENNESITQINSLLPEYIELAGDAVVLGNKKGEIIHMNQVLVDFTGYSKSEIIGNHISFIFEKDELEVNPLRFKDLDDGAEILTERCLRKKGGKGIPVEMHSKKTTDGYITIMRNISQRLEAQKQLKEMHDRLLFVTKMEAIGIIEIDLSNHQVTYNHIMCDILQIERSECSPTLDVWLHSIHTDDAERVKEGIDMVIETGNMMDLVYRISTEQDITKTLKSSANILRGMTHEPHKLIISSVDISSSNNLKNQLHEQIQTFRALTESTSAAIFIYSDKYLFANQAFERITGYSPSEARNFPFWHIVHPDHQELVKRRGGQRISGDPTIANYEFKIVTKSKEVKWIEFSAHQTKYLGKNAAIGTAFDITDRKNLELKLLQNINQIEEEKNRTLEIESQFRLYMEQNTAPMLAIDSSTKAIIFSNNAARKLYGYSEEEFLHLTAYDLQTISADEVDKKMKSALISDSNIFEFIHKKKNGTRFNVNVHASKILRDQMVALLLIIQDKTEELKNKSQLKQSHDTYQNILNSISEMIYIINLRGEFIFANQAALEKYGYELTELIGKTPEFLSAPGRNDLSVVKQAMAKAFEGEQNTINFWGLKKDKTVFPKEVVLSPGYYFDEKVIIAVSRDISEQIRITNELIAARDKAQESDRLKSAFLANMSHEIRTPMNAILGFSELVQDPTMEMDEKSSFLKIINRSSYHLLNLINDLVDISKINANQMKISSNIFSLNSIMMELIQYFNGELLNMQKQDKVELLYHYGLPTGNDLIITDETRLRQILNNIIGNAIKFTREGKVKIIYELIDNQLFFTISDTGIGMNEQQKQIVFERFAQADTNISQEFGGTGLGLAIAKSCVELLGGEIWVESEFGVGTKMHFLIPYQSPLSN